MNYSRKFEKGYKDGYLYLKSWYKKGKPLKLYFDHHKGGMKIYVNGSLLVPIGFKYNYSPEIPIINII
jgi:hypothetical protein